MNPRLPNSSRRYLLKPGSLSSIVVATVLFCSISYLSQAQSTTTVTFNYTTDGAVQNFDPPPGVTKVTVHAWGGGGAGGGVTNVSNNVAGGGGEGGNYLMVANVTVDPSTNPLTVAKGGAGASG